MKDQGSRKGTSRRAESTDAKAPAGTEGKVPGARDTPAPMTSKEKIAANQRNKKRR
jgi:hypothetical protein